MNHRTGWLLVLCVGLAICMPGNAIAQRSLSFDERVQAQEAIERVYYAHRLETTKPFEAAVSRRVLEDKVGRYLKQSRALETFWNTPITADMLSRETARMSGSSQMPERLAELFAALGNDPFLIEECLARPLLADRLTRNFFAYDRRVHGPTEVEARTVRADLVRGRLKPTANHPLRHVADLAEGDGSPSFPAAEDVAGEAQPARFPLPHEEFTEIRSKLHAGRIGALEEYRDRLLLQVLLEEERGRLRVATYAVPKKSWDAWWREVGETFDVGGVPAVSAGSSAGIVQGVAAAARNSAQLPSDRPAASWRLNVERGTTAAAPRPQNQEMVPEARQGHSAVWTGTRMIVWGGWNKSSEALSSGGLYDPATDTWELTSEEYAPYGRIGHTAVWAAGQMVVWGGSQWNGVVATGALYEPDHGDWKEMETVGAPSPRIYHTAVAKDELMMVWGGTDSQGTALGTGAVFNAEKNEWKPMSLEDAPLPRTGHSAVPTSAGMAVWGGVRDGTYLSSGARYDVHVDKWKALQQLGAPSARANHTAVWTGPVLDQMVVWGGGALNQNLQSGSRYSFTKDKWYPTSMVNAPPPRIKHTAIWSDEMARMVVWGGLSYQSGAASGGIYDPEQDSWSPTDEGGAPSGRYAHTVVAAWGGKRMIVWGGRRDEDGLYALKTGGVLSVDDNTWVPTTIGNTPERRLWHTAVWTGSEMIIWGGLTLPFDPIESGGRYDPSTDSWTATEVETAPFRRFRHTAVWSGSGMIVWGGETRTPSTFYLGDGGSYDPVSNWWTPISSTNAPQARTRHTAVWTYGTMTIWGGLLQSAPPTNTGARYIPDTDSWIAITTTNAPYGRFLHTAVGIGNWMIVYGGQTGAVVFNDGGRYDFSTGAWTPLSAVNRPHARTEHTAVSTGTEMIVWGGDPDGYGNESNDGGVYNPYSDSWQATTLSGAPSTRRLHTAVWTGSQMIIWGGTAPNDGKLYNRASNTWSSMTQQDAPVARTSHTAVWDGTEMIVWGGANASAMYQSGGHYSPAYDRWKSTSLD